ncbi:MAG TPA: phosphoglyceromutase [Acidimicrobiales bacterium]
MSPTLVLVRHGQSTWNERNLFTGWVDVDLTERGEVEARRSGELLAEHGVLPDVVHTSVQVRAIRTADIALTAAGRSWIPVRRSWRLNERHYGGLTGLDKTETSEKYGADQLHQWRRSYDVRPPPIGPDSEHDPGDDPRYADLDPAVLPTTECLADVVERVVPYWVDSVVPDLRAGRTVLISAHGNSLRALVKHLDDIDSDTIAGINIPTGIPLVYEIDPATMRPATTTGAAPPLRGRYLDPAAAAAGAAEVAAQGGPTA